MRFYLIALFLILIYSGSYAQISVEKWAKHNVDSLQSYNIDTLLYYNEYCDECFVKNKPLACNITDNHVEIENIIIYQQHGKFYSLEFNCSYPPIKKLLNNCSSIPYSISLIPVLDSRDKAIKNGYKKGKFLPPVISDGTFESVQIFFGKKIQAISMSKGMPEDVVKVWQNYFWFNKEVRLFRLIVKDID